MAPPVWAYQLDNFDPPPDEELICSVCRSVFCDPVQSPCNHVFCRDCICKWLEANRNCPICRKRTTRYTIQEVVPIVKNMIMKLTMYCRNKEKGCEEKIPLESCEGHLKVCSYEAVNCSNKPCKEMVLRKDLKDHELNKCLFRYYRCQSCFLKISSVRPIKHNCVKALKKRLREKNEMLKAKNLKIKELQKEIKALKQVRPESSDLSSLGSLSASDVMVNLPSVNDSFESTSSASEYDGNNSTRLVNLLSEGFRAYQDLLQQVALEPGSEHPRSSLPAIESFADRYPLITPLPDNPQIRRPPKRRLPARTLDSSEEDNDRNFEPPPAPSPKRTPCLQYIGEAGQSTSRAPLDVLVPSAHGYQYESAISPSTSTASGSRDEAQPSNSNIPFRLRPRDRRSSSEQVALPHVRRNSRGIFERTRALLEQYSLESDPEWVPPNPMDAEDVQSSDSDSSYHPPDYIDNVSSSSGSSSRENNSSANSSFIDVYENRNGALLELGLIFPEYLESDS